MKFKSVKITVFYATAKHRPVQPHRGKEIKMKNTKTTTMQTGNPFTELLRNYETATRNRTPQTETEYTKALQDLATACTYSVLKKLCNVGGYVDESTKTPTDTAKAIRQLRQSIAQDKDNHNRLNYAINHSPELQYNKDGELKQVVANKELYQSITKLINHCIGDGIDLINTAVTTILTETAKTTDINTDFMETPYTVRRLKRKVYIQDVNSLGGYETATTTPIQEVYKAIRRDIESNRAMQIANNKYTYISDILTDTESDTEEVVYRRLPKYSGLAYEITDINGKVTAITADIQTATDTDSIIAKMNLTAKQAKILQLRLSGNGYKSIATYLGITDSNVKGQIAELKRKAAAIGLTPTKN